MHHVLIRDEADETLFRGIREPDRPRLVVCADGDLYRIIEDPSEVCLVVNEERLCSFDQPHDHP